MTDAPVTAVPVTAAPVSGAPVPGAPAPGAAPAPADVRSRAWADLDPFTAYALLRLRVDVFVVEQECAYPELDGRDVEPATEHRWVDGPSAADPGADGPGDAPAVGAYLRVLADPGGVRRIGRVVTAPAARGRGLAGVLMTSVVADHAGSPLVLDAQAHLQHWYARWGFVAEGGEFLEDGIPHVRMARPADRP